MTVTVCTGIPTSDVAAGDEKATEDKAATEEEVTAVELEGPLINLPPMMLAFRLDVPALLFR